MQDGPAKRRKNSAHDPSEITVRSSVRGGESMSVKKRLRIASLIMLIIALVFVILAFLCMDVPIDVPLKLLKVVYKVYPIIMIGLFVASFVVKDKTA